MGAGEWNNVLKPPGVILRSRLHIGDSESSAYELREVGAQPLWEVVAMDLRQEPTIEKEHGGIVGERRLYGVLEPADPNPLPAARDVDLRRIPAPQPLPHTDPPHVPVMNPSATSCRRF